MLYTDNVARGGKLSFQNVGGGGGGEGVYDAVLHTENVARGGKLSFQNVGGAKVYTMY